MIDILHPHYTSISKLEAELEQRRSLNLHKFRRGDGMFEHTEKAIISLKRAISILILDTDFNK